MHYLLLPWLNLKNKTLVLNILKNPKLILLLYYRYYHQCPIKGDLLRNRFHLLRLSTCWTAKHSQNESRHILHRFRRTHPANLPHRLTIVVAVVTAAVVVVITTRWYQTCRIWVIWTPLLWQHRAIPSLITCQIILLTTWWRTIWVRLRKWPCSSNKDTWKLQSNNNSRGQ